MRERFLCAVNPAEFARLARCAAQRGHELRTCTPQLNDHISVVYSDETQLGPGAIVLIKLISKDPDSGRYVYHQDKLRKSDGQPFSGQIELALLHILSKRDYDLLTKDDPASHYSKKSCNILRRLGCLSLRKALASIWRMRSRVTPNF